MSAYSGALTPECLVECNLKIQAAFPDLTPDFYIVFSARIKELGFGDERLKDCINIVIDTCVYPKPTIAQFLSYDKRVKLYTYDQMLKLNNALNGLAMKLYKSVRVGESTKPLWASIQDIDIYKLELWKKKEK